MKIQSLVSSLLLAACASAEVVKVHRVRHMMASSKAPSPTSSSKAPSPTSSSKAPAMSPTFSQVVTSSSSSYGTQAVAAVGALAFGYFMAC